MSGKNRRTSAAVALVSDTHGYLDPRIAREIAGCDYAIHAGDIGCAAVLNAMRPRSRVIACGNKRYRGKLAEGGNRNTEESP